MIFEIDVSGPDILEKDYTIVIAEKNNASLLAGYKFSENIIQRIMKNFWQNCYRYNRSKKGKSNLRLRLYCIAIYYIFRELKKRIKNQTISLEVCRDFAGKEDQIKQNLEHFLGKLLGLDIQIVFLKLPSDSVADTYAYLFRKYYRNQFSKYLVSIGLEDFELFLKK